MKSFFPLAILFTLAFVSILTQSPESTGKVKIRDISQNLIGSNVNGNLGSSRYEPYQITWPGDELLPTVDNTFIGIRSLDVVSAEVDFTVELISSAYTADAATVDFHITAGALTDIKLLEHFIIVTFDRQFLLVY